MNKELFAGMKTILYTEGLVTRGEVLRCIQRFVEER